MRILYLDCFSGISGDMTVAALVDAGADRSYIEEELGRMKLDAYTLEWNRVNKQGISALKFDVILDKSHPPKHHRHYADIVKMIREAGFNERVTSLSQAIFEKIGIAEAKIHDIPLEKVHFHEVGAMDSIIDIIAVALAIDSLHISKIYTSPVPLGSGTVRMGHGIYPIPAPATLEMMKGLPIASSPYSVELTTPTGAGIISGICHEFSKSIPPMIVEAIGYGAGTRDMKEQPNVLRVIIGTMDPSIGQWQANHDYIVQNLHQQHGHHDNHHHDDHHHDNHHHDSTREDHQRDDHQRDDHQRYRDIFPL